MKALIFLITIMALCDMQAMDGQRRSSRIVSVRTNRVLNKHSLYMYYILNATIHVLCYLLCAC